MLLSAPSGELVQTFVSDLAMINYAKDRQFFTVEVYMWKSRIMLVDHPFHASVSLNNRLATFYLPTETIRRTGTFRRYAGLLLVAGYLFNELR